MISGPREGRSSGPVQRKTPRRRCTGRTRPAAHGAGTTVHSVSPAQAARCAGPSADVPDLAVRNASDRRALVSTVQCTRRRAGHQIVESKTDNSDRCSNSPVTLSLEPLSIVLNHADRRLRAGLPASRVWPTGFEVLDDALNGGFRSGDLVLL